MSITSILGAGEEGLIFAIMALGIFITFKILDFPDLTVDGSFTLGCAISAVFATQNQPILGIFLATLSGSCAGAFTGFLHTKMKVQYILAGIITMTGLYSINLKVANGVPNLSLHGFETIFSRFQHFLTKTLGIQSSFLSDNYKLILVAIILMILTCLLYFFFKTQTGLAIRATGNNEEMVRASSLNTDAMKILGLALANALVALCAAIYTQHQMFYAIDQGIGMMVIGLTSIIIGESIFGKRNLLNSFISLILGSFTYRLLLTFALSQGMNSDDQKLLCAALVAIVISLPTIKKTIQKGKKRYARYKKLKHHI